MSNRIIQTLKEAGFALLLPAFTLLMKADCFKRLVNSFEDPSRNLLTKCAYNLHWRYWRRRTYRPDAYKTFQKEYWETRNGPRISDSNLS
jgi:hypothetical protein